MQVDTVYGKAGAKMANKNMSAGMKRVMKGYTPKVEVGKQEGASRKRVYPEVNKNKVEEFKNILENYEDHLKKTIENCSKNTKAEMGAKHTIKTF